jgi:hypothetical protein
LAKPQNTKEQTATKSGHPAAASLGNASIELTGNGLDHNVGTQTKINYYEDCWCRVEKLNKTNCDGKRRSNPNITRDKS